VSRPVDEDDEEEGEEEAAAEGAALCWDEEMLVLTETLDELDEVEVKKVVLAAAEAAVEEVEGTAEDEGSAREGAPLAQTRVPFLMPSRTSASETMLPLSEYMTTVGPAT
jgi:hypothetical protein